MGKGKFTGKVMPMALAAALALSPISASAASSDLQGHWAEKVITEWQNRGLVSGYADGTFKPNSSIKRSEVVTMVNKAMGYYGTTNINFKDVGAGRWYYSAVATAVWADYISGYPDGTFKPDATVNRAEAAAIISNVAGLMPDESVAQYFTDNASIPSWAKGSIGAVINAGLMSGYPDGSFGAKKPITRAEMISSLDRVQDWKASSAVRIAQQQIQAQQTAQTITANSTIPSTLWDYYNLIYPTTTSNNTPSTNPANPVATASGDRIESLRVTEDGEKIKNRTITGDLLIDEDVEDGDVYVEDTIVDGNIVVNGGGGDSIYLTDVRVGGKIIVNKKGVHIELAGDTRIKQIDLKEPAEITEDDLDRDVDKITIKEDMSKSRDIVIDVPVDKIIVDGKCSLVIKADVGEIEVTEDGEDSTIEIKRSATVDTLIADAAVELMGKGTIENLEVNADDVEVDGDLDIEDIDVDNGVDDPIINGGDGDNNDKDENTGTDTTAPKVSAVDVTEATGSTEVTVSTSDPTKLSCVKDTKVQKITVTMDEAVSLVDGAKNEVAMEMSGAVGMGTVYGTFAIDSANAKKIVITPAAGNEIASREGTVTFTVPANTLQDAAGNKNTTAYTFTLEVKAEATEEPGASDEPEVTAPKIASIAVDERKDVVADGQPTVKNDDDFTVSGGGALSDNSVTITVTETGTVENDTSTSGAGTGRYVGIGITVNLSDDSKAIERGLYYSKDESSWSKLEKDGDLDAKIQDSTFIFYLNADDFKSSSTVKRYIKLGENGDVITLNFKFEAKEEETAKISGITDVEALTRLDVINDYQPKNLPNDGWFKVKAGDFANNAVTITVTANKSRLQQETPVENNSFPGKYLGVALQLTFKDNNKDITNVKFGADDNSITTQLTENAALKDDYKKNTIMFYLNAEAFTATDTVVTRYIALDEDTIPVALRFELVDDPDMTKTEPAE